MNFWIIFLSLMIGAVVGFEFGKYIMSKRLSEMLKEFGEALKAKAEEAKKKQAETKEKLNQLTADFLKTLAKNDKNQEDDLK